MNRVLVKQGFLQGAPGDYSATQKALLFVREFTSDRVTGGAEAYTYPGTASYVNHQNSKPMNIIWHPGRPIPAKFLKKTNKLVVG